MIAVSLMLFALIQCSQSCRSTTDCTETDVIPNDPVVTAPSLTVEQAEILNNLYQELMQLPCDERRERIYNTTVPPINLTESQGLALLDLYPEYFKNRSDTGDVSNKTGSSFLSERAAATSNVCSFEPIEVVYNLALDANGDPVYIPQIVTENPPYYVLHQTFQEYLCASDQCAPGLSCQCLHELGHSDRSIVSYLNATPSECASGGLGCRFYVQPIMLTDCSAYLIM
ncbi:uncharacterized protein [Antedon mediterranea]|uniref:uncharacterized protein isoform X1 n=1 Tax=Antedon mediterranea TaxID=105859 RepID=UPI003AF90B64